MAIYLVTGAAGFIGSNFVQYLLSDVPGAEVVALDNLGFAANIANLDQVRRRIRFVEADIADLGVMHAVYEELGPDYVVNFAAESHNDRAMLTAAVRPARREAATRPELLPVYDVSARHEVTNLAIAELILGRLGQDPGAWIEHVTDRPNHDRRYLIEPAKLERELGWRPVTDFAAGLAETVDWYVANEAWWQDILRRKGDLQIAWAGAR